MIGKVTISKVVPNSGARKSFRALVFVFLLSTGVFAQTIRPLLTEYRGKASGSFELVNDSFVPVNVVLEAKSFIVTEDGQMVYSPLDPSIQIKYSAPSFRISPKRTYRVAYDATATKLPAYFVIYATIAGLPIRTNTGMNINVQLPHTVYILGKKDATKPEIEVLSAKYDVADKKVLLDVTSHSTNFGRVLITEAHAGKTKVEGPGFPVYPGKRRKTEIEWTEDFPPEKVVIRFQDFTIEVPVSSK